MTQLEPPKCVDAGVQGSRIQGAECCDPDRSGGGAVAEGPPLEMVMEVGAGIELRGMPEKLEKGGNGDDAGLCERRLGELERMLRGAGDKESVVAEMALLYARRATGYRRDNLDRARILWQVLVMGVERGRRKVPAEWVLALVDVCVTAAGVAEGADDASDAGSSRDGDGDGDGDGRDNGEDGRNDEAELLLRFALKTVDAATDTAEIWAARGRIYGALAAAVPHLPDDSSAADYANDSVSAYETALSLRRPDAGASVAWARAFVALGRFQDALVELEAAGAHGKEAEGLRGQALQGAAGVRGAKGRQCIVC